jgi:hypothetical protein
MLMVGVILLTSTVRPCGGEFQQTLHNIEIMSLTCTYLTLWAGSVFNTYPQCEDPTKSSGETLVWCDALSFIVSLINFFSIGVFVVVYFIARRGDEQKVTKAAIQKERRSFGTFAELELDNENEESSGVELTPLSQPQHRGSEISNVLIDNAWERHLDEVSGNWYAHNRASGATIWEADKKRSRSVIVYQEQKTNKSKTKTKTKTETKTGFRRCEHGGASTSLSAQIVRFHAAVDAAHNRQGLPNVPHDHQPTRAPRDQIIPVLAKHQRIQTFIDFNGMQLLSVLKKVENKSERKVKSDAT